MWAETSLGSLVFFLGIRQIGSHGSVPEIHAGLGERRLTILLEGSDPIAFPLEGRSQFDHDCDLLGIKGDGLLKLGDSPVNIPGALERLAVEIMRIGITWLEIFGLFQLARSAGKIFFGDEDSAGIAVGLSGILIQLECEVEF